MSINSVIITGRLTKDPELTKSQNGLSICKFTVAVDRNIKKDEQNPNQQTADFIGCTVFRQGADYLSKDGEKGSQVAVQGRLQTGSYTNRDGQKVFTTDVMCDRVELIKGTSSSRSDAPHNGKSVYVKDMGSDNNYGFDTGDMQSVNSDDLPF